MEKLFRYTRHIIAILIVLGSFGFLFSLVYHAMPAGNTAVLQIAAGIVLGVLAAVTGYYFGSSKDKSDQDKLITSKPITS